MVAALREVIFDMFFSQRGHVGDATLPRHGVEVTRSLELLEIEGAHGACLVRNISGCSANSTIKMS